MIPQPDYIDKEGALLTVVKDTEGNIFYYKDKEKQIRHRADGPAKVWKNGDEEWWYDGKLHREDGPASTHIGGYFTFNGVLTPALTISYYIDGIICQQSELPFKALAFRKPKMVIFM